MTTLVVVGLVFATAVIITGLQVTANQLQQFGLDNRPPGPVIESDRRKRFVVRPPELEQLRSVVEESLGSEAVAEAKLRPLLERLQANAPRPPATGLTTGVTHGGRPAGARRIRRHRTWFDGELAELERRWELREDTD